MSSSVLCGRSWLFGAAMFLSATSGVSAWGSKAHRVIAAIAEERLNSTAAAQVKSLLASEQEHSLADVSVWADSIRRSPEFRFSSNAHFIDLPIGGNPVDFKQYCADGDCLTESLAAVMQALTDPTQPLEKRAIALKFVVHLVGDAHQPLHCATNDDSGANRVSVFYRSRRLSLHAVWDTAAVDDIATDELKLLATAKSKITSGRIASWTSANDPMEWVRESFGLAQHTAYSLPSLLRHEAPPAELPDSYVAGAQDVISEQLAKAGIRLAEYLNRHLTAPHENVRTFFYPQQSSSTPNGAGRETPVSSTSTIASRMFLAGGGALSVIVIAAAVFVATARRRRSVFICYRRKDTQGEVGRIADRLMRTFGKRFVFRDLDSLHGGSLFAQEIVHRLAQCDVVIAVIGPNWTQGFISDGSEDFVYKELDTAIRLEVPVIPILVQNARMPRGEELRSPLQALCDRNYIEIDDHLFDASVKSLIDAIRQMPRRGSLRRISSDTSRTTQRL